MSWHDIMNRAGSADTDEPEEDRALRRELGEMLGVGPPGGSAGPADMAAMAALSQSLYREAVRRRASAAGLGGSGAPAGSVWGRPLFAALAAAVPLAVTLAALGTWGAGLKRREEALAAKTMELEARQSRLEEAMEAARGGQPVLPTPPVLQASGSPGSPRPAAGAAELVKPEESPARLAKPGERHMVKDRR
jgi:hypothetical protein